jgi:hypothetical protein
MRALLLSLALGLGSLGLTFGAPTQAQAQVPVNNGTVQTVAWHGWHGGWHRGWYGGYYRPYWGGYYRSWYGPRYYGGWYYPGYSSYYYGAYPSGGFYSPWVSVWW